MKRKRFSELSILDFHPKMDQSSRKASVISCFVGNKMKRALYMFLVLILAVGCGTSEKEPSKWVGRYEFETTVYHADAGKVRPPYQGGRLTYVVGDVPHLFAHGSRLLETVLVNNDEQLTIFGPEAGKAIDATGRETGDFIHMDTTITFYARSQTAEEVLLSYRSETAAFDRSATGEINRSVGPYRKVNSKNTDCRKLEPPCKE